MAYVHMGGLHDSTEVVEGRHKSLPIKRSILSPPAVSLTNPEIPLKPPFKLHEGLDGNVHASNKDKSEKKKFNNWTCKH